MGKPGSGKTTQLDLIHEKYCICSYGEGIEMRRAWASNGDSEMSKHMHENYEAFGYSDTSKDTKLLHLKLKGIYEMIKSPKCANGVIIDGLIKRFN
jgi:adenylate kinase family enzyme